MMKLKDLLKVLNPHTLLDISAINKRGCVCYTSKAKDVAQKYLNYYVDYAAVDFSYNCYGNYDGEFKPIILLDIYKHKEDLV